MTSLDRVPVGWSARVSRVVGDDPATLRLLEMGHTPGLTLRVVGSAPLGDPIELELRGYRLSIRRREAAFLALAMLSIRPEKYSFSCSLILSQGGFPSTTSNPPSQPSGFPSSGSIAG